MIILPEEFSPNDVEFSLIDPGFFQPGANGAEDLRITRPGARWALTLAFPPMTAERGNVLASLLRRARDEGVRVKLPLNTVNQGEPGVPVVDGAGVAGTTLPLRGLTPGWACKVGYWLSLTDASGQLYLHQVDAGGIADAAGELSVTIGPPVRAAIADGSTVLIARPEVQGWTPGDLKWQALPGGLSRGFGVTLREAR